MHWLRATCTIPTPRPPDAPEKQAASHTEKHAGRCVGRSTISAQSPTPNRTSLSPDPGWNLAPLPLCMQYRWQDRRACWCRKAVPVLRRWQGGKALAEKGHQDHCLLPWSQPLFQRLLGRFGSRGFSLLDATIQVFKGPPSSPQIVCPAWWNFFLLLSEQLLIYHSFPCPFVLI